MADSNGIKKKYPDRPRDNRYVVRYYDEAGDEHWKTIEGYKNAVAYRLKMKGSVADGTYLKPKKILFRDLAARYLTTIQTNVEESTHDSYEGHIRLYLNPQFGHLQVRAIETEAIELYLAELVAAGNISPTTVGNILVTLKSVLETGVRWKYLTTNEARVIKKPPSPDKPLEFYDQQEISRLLEAADERHYALLLTAVIIAPRRSELLGLRWSNIDFSGRFVHITHQVKKGKLTDRLKTRNSRRRVPLPPRLAEVLRRHQTRLIVDGPENPLDLVFPSTTGTPMQGPNLERRIYKPTLSRAGLKPIKFHALRHSFATIRLQQGRSLMDVSAWLGHSDVGFTAKTYAHYLPNEVDDKPDELEAAIFGRETPKVVLSVV